MLCRRTAVVAWLLLPAGCTTLEILKDESQTTQVSAHPFDPRGNASPLTKVSYRPGSTDAAWRVDEAGRKLIGANPQAGVRPAFAVIGTAESEIFHADTRIVYVTEGLVRQCRDDATLTAVLASELGKMISERETAAPPEVRRPNHLPPVQLPIGGNGYGHAADPTNYIELAKFEKTHPKTRRPLTPPEPQAVARKLFASAGFKDAEFDAAAPLLKAAERNCTLEYQLKGNPKQGDWQP